MTNYQKTAYKILKLCDAFIVGSHFVYSSGMHGDFYINKDALYLYPKLTDNICVMMTEVAVKTFGEVDCVLAPAVAGLVLGQNIAYNLSLQFDKDVLFSYSERNTKCPEYRTIKRGYEKIFVGKRVLLVDDIVNTGNTLNRMFESVVGLGGNVVGAVALCDRGKQRTLSCTVDNSKLEVAVISLVELDTQTFSPDNCPFCKSGRPIEVTLGEGQSVDLFRNAKKVEEDECEEDTMFDAILDSTGGASSTL